MKKGFVVIQEVIITAIIIIILVVTVGLFLPAPADIGDIFLGFVNKVNYANQYSSSDIFYFEFPANHRILQFYVDDCCIMVLKGLGWDKSQEGSIADLKLNPEYKGYFPSYGNLESQWHEKYILCVYEDKRDFPNTGKSFIDDNVGIFEDLAQNCPHFFSDDQSITQYDDIVDESVICNKLERPIIDSNGNGLESITGPWDIRNINFVRFEQGIIISTHNEEDV